MAILNNADRAYAVGVTTATATAPTSYNELAYDNSSLLNRTTQTVQSNNIYKGAQAGATIGTRDEFGGDLSFDISNDEAFYLIVQSALGNAWANGECKGGATQQWLWLKETLGGTGRMFKNHLCTSLQISGSTTTVATASATFMGLGIGAETVENVNEATATETVNGLQTVLNVGSMTGLKLREFSITIAREHSFEHSMINRAPEGLSTNAPRRVNVTGSVIMDETNYQTMSAMVESGPVAANLALGNVITFDMPAVRVTSVTQAASGASLVNFAFAAEVNAGGDITAIRPTGE